MRQSEVAKRSELFRLKFRALLVGASEQLAEAYIVKRRVASPLCPKDLLTQWQTGQSSFQLVGDNSEHEQNAAEQDDQLHALWSCQLAPPGPVISGCLGLRSPVAFLQAGDEAAGLPRPAIATVRGGAYGTGR